MSFSVPEFPVVCGIWRNGLQFTDPPSLTAPCNVALGRRTVVLGRNQAFEADAAVVQLLFPRGTDVRDNTQPGGRDVVEVPLGSGRIYEVEYVNDLGTGFSNEHRVALVQKLIPWPAPLPAVFVP